MLIILSICLLTTGMASAQTSDENLRNILNFINKDSLKRTVQDLQNFESRLCTKSGADDNATGCAIMIEMVRIIYENNLKPYYNIDFMGYDAEEIGLLGSYYDAQKRKAANENVIVMLNNDMVGTQPKDTEWKVTLRWYENSLDVREKAEQALINYTTVIPYIPNGNENEGRRNSDSWSYYCNNFKANFAIEHTFSPNYHSVNDLIEYLNFEYCQEIARMNFVLLADYSAIVFTPEVAVNEAKNEAHRINVFPNPATEVIRVHNDNAIKIHQIDMYDMSGRLIESIRNIMSQQNVISLNTYKSGIYFMRIHTNNGIVNKKIIKQ
ncbi:MAG: M28 family peptidase [Lentimicrobiaceae bacterium]|nr:M28 family peptidase [Lentimicrobiaceae bacterium]